MLTRAIAAFAALPGMVAFAIPVSLGVIAGRSVRYPALAALLLVAGTLLLLRCVLEFYTAGRGTLAPWSPPRHLVTSGPYRFCRNPMYVAVMTILLGWCTLWDAHVLVWYAAGTACAFQLRVLFFEEPWAARTFGEQWQAYRARVRRWAI